MLIIGVDFHSRFQQIAMGEHSVLDRLLELLNRVQVSHWTPGFPVRRSTNHRDKQRRGGATPATSLAHLLD